MKQRIGAIIGVLVAALGLVIAAVFIVASNQPAPSVATVSFYDYSDIKSLAAGMDFSGYEPYSVIPADANTGYLADKVLGDPEKAAVVIYEFVDYACSHCADANTELNRLYHEYEGQVAIVFRNYLIGFQNSVASASAANAAAIQGYWEPFKNILFSEQAVWSRLQGGKLEEYFIDAFDSIGGGDTAQFIKDMGSEAVVQRIIFDQAAGSSIGVSGTPYLVVDGQHLTLNEIRDLLAATLDK